LQHRPGDIATAEVLVNGSPRGYFAGEPASALHAEAQEALQQLTQQRRLAGA
jgi:hypothetical protein